MTKLTPNERRHLEIAFESSCAIVNLAIEKYFDEVNGLDKRIIEGELTFDEAVKIVLTGYAVRWPR